MVASYVYLFSCWSCRHPHIFSYIYLLKVNENKQTVEDKQQKHDQKLEETKTEPKPDKKDSAPDKTDDSDMTGQL